MLLACTMLIYVMPYYTGIYDKFDVCFFLESSDTDEDNFVM